MKKTTLFKSFFIASIFALGSITSWAATQTITITLESSGITATSYDSGAERTWTQEEVSFGGKFIMKGSGENANAIQAQANNGLLYNTTAIPGKITSIAITSSGTARESYLYGGNARLVNNTAGNIDVTGGTQVGEASTTGWTADDFADTSYSYFAIKRSSNAAYWTEIVITYEEAICTNPNLSFDAEEVIFTTGSSIVIDGIVASSDNETTPIQYSSSDDTFATVDAETGEVSIEGNTPGIVTITATQLEDAGYCLGVATYTIYVNPEEKTFELVTSDSQLEAGANYLIVGFNEEEEQYYALGGQNANNRAPVAVEVENNEIETSIAYSAGSTFLPYVLTLGENSAGWTLTDPTLEKMIGPDNSASANNHLKPSEGEPTWTIEIDSETSEAAIVCFGDEANTNDSPRNTLRFNNNNLLFACYVDGGQTPVYLYKEVTGTSGIGSSTNDEFNFYVNSGTIYFTTSAAGETVEIYNTVGKRIYQGTTVNGLNSIAAESGIVLVKIGNNVNKVLVK